MKALVYRNPGKVALRGIRSHGSSTERILARFEAKEGETLQEDVSLQDHFDICREMVTTGGRATDRGATGSPVQWNMEKPTEQQIELTSNSVHSITAQMLLET
jgi:hypothetical protein